MKSDEAISSLHYQVPNSVLLKSDGTTLHFDTLSVVVFQTASSTNFHASRFRPHFNFAALLEAALKIDGIAIGSGNAKRDFPSRTKKSSDDSPKPKSSSHRVAKTSNFKKSSSSTIERTLLQHSNLEPPNSKPKKDL